MRAAARPANEAPTMMTEAGGGSTDEGEEDEDDETVPPMVFCVLGCGAFLCV